jgi:hypothetical protein
MTRILRKIFEPDARIGKLSDGVFCFGVASIANHDQLEIVKV